MLTVVVWLSPCVQDYWGVTQEEASWKEADRIQNPCTQHPLPSHCQGASGTLLVAVTYTLTCFYAHSGGKIRHNIIQKYYVFFPSPVSFSTFGELKTVRLPKKAAGSGNHRGFGFIDFLTKQDAKVCAVILQVNILFLRVTIKLMINAILSLYRKLLLHSATAPICTGDASCWSGLMPRKQ